MKRMFEFNADEQIEYYGKSRTETAIQVALIIGVSGAHSADAAFRYRSFIKF